ncbi:HesA/MoeB/ThiF family protein [Mariprofundus ferrooxydans]|uniref:HesA/MoeB/ThiF family protein n=1 Tax=Mariprofundus ferrooxydans TaxID=314344 RepID=UPI001431FD16|nr:ThiF family adenylyltransferase [Mariprofundus ferrooxydans]
MEPWFIRYPKRYRREKSELRDAGFQAREALLAKEAGIIQLHVDFFHKGKPYSVVVEYPTFYPYMPFQMVSKDIPKGRHLGEYGGAVCFLEDVHQNWEPHYTLAHIIDTQVRGVIDRNLEPSDDPTKEGLYASPASGHIRYRDNCGILVPNFSIPEGHRYGHATLSHGPHVNLKKTPSGHISKVTGTSKQDVLYTVGDDLPNLAGVDPMQLKNQGVRWVRLDRPPAAADDGILDEAIRAWPELEKPNYRNGVDITAIIFQEESTYKCKQVAWVFVVREKQLGVTEPLYFNVRADILDPQIVIARTSRTKPLTGKKVVLIGCGALGSTIGFQLGRMNLNHLVLIDGDHLKYGNLPRWIAGASATGRDKVSVLRELITDANPMINVTTHPLKFGDINQREPEQEMLNDVFDADLIIDATAEFAASHLITLLAKEHAIPCIHVSATNGGFGGIVGRYMPEPEAFCWSCMQEALYQERPEFQDDDYRIRLPATEPGEPTEVRGCFHPTFIGTGFDLDAISMQAVRLAVATLCRGAEGAYPDLDWDIAVIDLWDEDKSIPIDPKMTTYRFAGAHRLCRKPHE